MYTVKIVLNFGYREIVSTLRIQITPREAILYFAEHGVAGSHIAY